MRAAGWMAAAAVGSAAVAAAIAGRSAAAEVLFGMLAPMAAVTVSWVLTERVYRREPARLTGVMIAAFVAKMVFFGAYVALMLEVIGLRPTPFAVSFTIYFIGLYAAEAFLMRRLFATAG
ncbi:MAG TPA: hypothetical protein VKE51_31850 [Vicinamibacterales bacterium]|nr:hypothetical protein [Vicinamibacterales bacterium]